MAYTQEQLIADLAKDIQIADHAYQLALATGDLNKVRQAKQFLSQCETHYHLEKRDWFKRQTLKTV